MGIVELVDVDFLEDLHVLELVELLEHGFLDNVRVNVFDLLLVLIPGLQGDLLKIVLMLLLHFVLVDTQLVNREGVVVLEIL